MDALITFTIEALAALLGIVVGTLLALDIDRRKERRRRRGRAQSLLRSLQLELDRNHRALVEARPAFRKTRWGRSFHVETTAWDTAVAGGDLPDVIGVQLVDALTEQYGALIRLRYSLDLMTRLWMAPRDIEGYESMRSGFHHAIEAAMDEAVERYSRVCGKISSALREGRQPAVLAALRVAPRSA
jgi:hypothetical protein